MLQGKRCLGTIETEVCSVKRMQPKRCAQGRFFTSSRPGHSPPQEVNTKAASTGVSAVTQQGSPYRRQDEGLVSQSHSTRKQLPAQCVGLSGYTQLSPAPPEEGYAPDPFLLQGICSERRGGMSYTFTNHFQSSEGLLPTTALLSHRDNTVTEQGTLTQVHFSPSASVLASDFIAESLEKGVSSPFPKGRRFPAQGIAATPKVQHGTGEKNIQPQNPKSVATWLTFRRFEGDPREHKSQQVL